MQDKKATPLVKFTKHHFPIGTIVAVSHEEMKKAKPVIAVRGKNSDFEGDILGVDFVTDERAPVKHYCVQHIDDENLVVSDGSLSYILLMIGMGQVHHIVKRAHPQPNHVKAVLREKRRIRKQRRVQEGCGVFGLPLPSLNGTVAIPAFWHGGKRQVFDAPVVDFTNAQLVMADRKFFSPLAKAVTEASVPLNVASSGKEKAVALIDQEANEKRFVQPFSTMDVIKVISGEDGKWWTNGNQPAISDPKETK